jgi:uncharacterized heparinase superfamily protein
VTTLSRYYHTARHLRPIQIVARMRLALPKPRPDLRPPPAVRRPGAAYAAPIAREPSLLGPETFRLLNTERRCQHAGDWQPPDASQLWTYHLHYFDDLNARDATGRAPWHRELLSRWVVENPPPHGPGWDSYPVSRRVVNWVKWGLGGQVLSAPCQASLAVQARWLMRRLEHHILGNHLLVNAKALVHAGLYFDGAEADRWYSRGMRIIERQLHEQVLDDGAHFELSPMYHASALEDLLDLVNILSAFGRPVPEHWLALLARMRDWLAVMTHPDGEIAFFNDAAFGAAPTQRELAQYAHRLRLPAAQLAHTQLATLAASGYLRAALGAAYLICDCGPVGPDYQPGHAHADTLSFELSIAGRRVFVNSGTSQYGADAERQRQRGTGAHNTVIIDAADSSEVWSGFRVARRARAELRRVSETQTSVCIEASHDGYCRLAGKSEHFRRWILERDSLRIEDRLSGSFCAAEAHLFLHPDVGVQPAADGAMILTLEAREIARVSFEGAARVAAQPATWHPRFGVVIPNLCLVAQFSGPTLTTRVCWER